MGALSALTPNSDRTRHSSRSTSTGSTHTTGGWSACFATLMSGASA